MAGRSVNYRRQYQEPTDYALRASWAERLAAELDAFGHSALAAFTNAFADQGHLYRPQDKPAAPKRLLLVSDRANKALKGSLIAWRGSGAGRNRTCLSCAPVRGKRFKYLAFDLVGRRMPMRRAKSWPNMSFI
jgi:hypothetical protein